MPIGKASRRLKNAIKRQKVLQWRSATKTYEEKESQPQQNDSFQLTMCPFLCNAGQVIEPVKKQ